MARELENLNNLLSKKETASIDIIGNCDKNGILVQRLTQEIKLNREVSHKIALSSLETSSFFPNITLENNNKFYYSTGTDNKVKEITLDEGAYEINGVRLVAITMRYKELSKQKVTLKTTSLSKLSPQLLKLELH